VADVQGDVSGGQKKIAAEEKSDNRNHMAGRCFSEKRTPTLKRPPCFSLVGKEKWGSAKGREKKKEEKAK